MVSCRPWLREALRLWGRRRRDRRRERPPVRVERTLSPARGEGAGPEPAAAATSAPGGHLQDEQCERLRIAVSWCRPGELAVISWHLRDGRGYGEIAAELGITDAAARRRFRRAVRRVGEALSLLERMTRLGWGALRQDVVGMHRFQGAEPAEIAERLQVPEALVVRWIAEARPLFPSMAGSEGSS
jgi:DNA-directed RNA polymerase specialized sigma24 family protein